eukprot:TRINITY_DN1479_c0_g1_i1.p1 TRINITY_DN1479_c0_g1~~TRINITY_DN1479_c0_g1_i1.p1  ORF type:complete len:195 (-),score=45.93 TRINITY_DN1479_c0_g1_i1:532-1116(-)
MLSGVNMAQLCENKNLPGELAKVGSFGSISSEVMIKQLIIQEMIKYGKNPSQKPVEEEEVNQFVSQLMDSVMDSVVSKVVEQPKEQKVVASPSYDEWISQSVGSFALSDFSINDEGFAEYQEEEEEEEEIGVKENQRDIERTDFAKDVVLASQPKKLKEVKSFALYDIEIEYYEEYQDFTSSDEEDHLSLSSSA